MNVTRLSQKVFLCESLSFTPVAVAAIFAAKSFKMSAWRCFESIVNRAGDINGYSSRYIMAFAVVKAAVMEIVSLFKKGLLINFAPFFIFAAFAACMLEMTIRPLEEITMIWAGYKYGCFGVSILGTRIAVFILMDGISFIYK